MVTRGMSKDVATMVLLVFGMASVLGSLIGGIVGDYAEQKKKKMVAQ